MRRSSCHAQLPGPRRGLRHAWPRGRLREGRAFHRHGGAPALAAANISAAKRILAATDKSIAWLADPSHRGEAIELLVKVARSARTMPTPVTTSCTGSIISSRPARSRAPSLRNLVAMEQRAGTVDPAFANRPARHAGCHRTHGLNEDTMKTSAP